MIRVELDKWMPVSFVTKKPHTYIYLNGKLVEIANAKKI